MYVCGMKNRKAKPIKSGSSRKKVPSDVSPSTSLPPLVEGQLRCFLRVTVSRVLWTITKPPSETIVRLRWWGESASGTLFRPRDGSQTAQRGVKSTTRFPVRCGPKQLTSYLTDMGSLVLDILTKPDHLPIARVQIGGIARLSINHSISGFFTLVSPTSEKLGELQAILALEALTEAYDTGSSVPTTDISVDTAMSVPDLPKALSEQNELVVPPAPLRLSDNSGKCGGSGSVDTPRGKDHLYFQTNPEGDRGKLRAFSGHSQTGTTIATQVQGSADKPAHSLPANGNGSVDLLSVLLERGSKLRNAMVISALKSDVDAEMALKDIPLPLPRDNRGPPSRVPPMHSSGGLLQNLLHSEPSLLQSIHYPSTPCLEQAADHEDIAVDLLLGSVNGSVLHIWDGEGSPPDSLSGLSSLCLDSELNDPQYDQSLLENLFYKTHAESCLGEDMAVEEEQRRKMGQEGKPGQSGTPAADDKKLSKQTDTLPGLSVDRMAMLEGTHVARVTILGLAVPTDGSSTSPKKLSGRGKPPRPLSTRKCSYFVEYRFPLAPAGRCNAQAAEATRVASSKVTGGVVTFQQRSVFPVRFDESAVRRLWDAELMFQIYCRRISERKPLPIGIAVLPLRSVLQSDRLSLTSALPVQGLHSDRQELGPLKVSVELAADKNDFQDKRQAAGGSKAGPRAHRDASPAQREPPASTRRDVGDAPASPHADNRRAKRDLSPMTGPHPAQNVLAPSTSSDHEPRRSLGKVTLQQQQQVGEDDPLVLLHALLEVPNGKDFNHGQTQPPNVYLNCKLFGSDETTRSAVSWGQTDPTFNLVQVAPVVLTPKLLERMRNNMLVVEVWQKGSHSGDEKLLGLVKLPLHQFYMSFRDPKISELLLQSQYPVVGADGWLPVVDVFSGGARGSLRVCLAMGLAQQIVALQRLRDEELGNVLQMPRPMHLLDHRPQPVAKEASDAGEAVSEHVFLLKVERARGLTPLQATVWGEADCYVQYSFPAQEESAQNVDKDTVESSVSLRQVRTATTLCVPDPVFGHAESHALLAPAGVPVQRLLLSCLSGQGLRDGGGVQFEVWCRYYYPNVRDQLVAKGVLPLSKLCALATMQRQGHADVQLFSLPLVPRTDCPPDRHCQPTGLLEVSVQYQRRPLRTDGGKSRALASSSVTLVVQVHRAAGLQAAARALADADQAFRYYADVGVNSYVSAQLSFLPDGERRSTRVVARTFCPEFEHHAEFSCPLLLRRAAGETLSLAEVLQEAEVTFSVYNRDSRRGGDITRRKDTLLGEMRLQLADLIHRRTGISGWYSLCLPRDPDSSHGSFVSAGGLEISVRFGHRADRERVISAARGLGWETAKAGEEDEDDDEDEGELKSSLSLTLAVPRVWVPVHCLLLPGHNELQRSTYCYYRYKLYDTEAFCSALRHPIPQEGEEGMATVVFQAGRRVELRRSQPLHWYLQEERLEVELWVAFAKDRRSRPYDTDRLVGSAFVDLSALAACSEHKQAVSGVYPLFKRSANDLAGAAIRVHVAGCIRALPAEPLPAGGSEEQETEGSEPPSEAEEDEATPAAAATPGQPHGRGRTQTASDLSPDLAELSREETFSVTINVERAMHLSLRGCPLAERGGGLPCCCVSYAAADASGTVTTAVVPDSTSPVWDHQEECRLSKELLLDPQQSLVFKVWHKGDVERVIGFASVDLSPLLSGFQSVCGWYNITDFSGQCQGQLKVAVSPLRGVHELRAQRQTAPEDASRDSAALFSAVPLCYQTTSTYTTFPSHISRFPEQRINASPDQLGRLLSERSSMSDRHDEHVDHIRLFHQTLQDGERAPPPFSSGDPHPSSSALFSALRKNLSELDDIQRYFSRKLSTPTFPVPGESDRGSRLEEHRDSETDSAQLLLKSNQLVGQVNDIIKGLTVHRADASDANTLSGADTPALASECVHSPEEQLDVLASGSYEAVVCLPRDPETGPGTASPPASPASDEPSEASLAAEELRHDDRGAPSSEDEAVPEECIEEEEVEDDEEFEETLIEPRQLNEVTSVTDRTSPWTSVLSDPDLSSVENLEAGMEQPAPDIPSSTHEEETDPRSISPTANPPVSETSACEELQRYDDDEDEDDDDVSYEAESGDADTVRTAGDTCEDHLEDGQESTNPCLPEDSLLGIREEAGEDSKGMPSSGDMSPRTLTQSEPHADTSSPDGDQTDVIAADEKTTKLSDPLVIPNFFLPSHHLEASMRALRLAPVFPSASSQPDPQHGILYRRGNRPRPNIPPSSLKREETKRIAKIFASTFKEEQ